jgi:glucokinase
MGQDAYALGIDLGGTKIDVGLVDTSGKVLSRELIPTSKAGPEQVVADIVAAAKKLGIQEKKILCAGVGMAGQIEADTGVVWFAPNLSWHHFPLGAKLSSALGVPVTVVNDVRAAAWGEWLYGAGKGCDDLVCVFVGTGIGGGIVSGGRMLTGSTNAAGEVGHITIDLDGPVCSCGNYGCFEAFAGGWAIARNAKEVLSHIEESNSHLLSLVHGNIDEITAKHVFESYRSNDPVACAVIDRAKEALIAGISALINIFNPSRVILGGGIIQHNPDLIESVKKGVPSRALKAATKSVSIVPAQLKGDAGVVGSAACAYNSIKKEKR